MKRKIIIAVSVILVLVSIGYGVFSHFNPHVKLVGTWTGDGTLDLLGDSPFDGATELTFFTDSTGYVITEQGKISFSYSIRSAHDKWNTVILEDADEYIYAQSFYIDGKTLNIDKDGEIVSFTRK